VARKHRQGWLGVWKAHCWVREHNRPFLSNGAQRWQPALRGSTGVAPHTSPASRQAITWSASPP